MLIQPLKKFHVVGDPAQQGHGRMTVGIVKRRQSGIMRTVYFLIKIAGNSGTDFRDPVPLDRNIRTLTVQFDIFDQNAHIPLSFNSSVISPSRSTACHR